jgi:hypothetical protein
MLWPRNDAADPLEAPAAARRDPPETEVRMPSRDIATRPTHVRILARVLACACVLAALLAPAMARAAVYNPLNIISYDTWRASRSMSIAEIQAFLDTQAGPLKSLVTTDYVNPGGANGYGTPWVPGQPAKSAAQIIGEAAQYWNLNPKVILATLDKEQSLISEATHVAHTGNSHGTVAYHLPHAMGYGVYSGSTNSFPGFGNQVFNGARGFSTHWSLVDWVPGLRYRVQVSATKEYIWITPLNAPTFRLYTYTPYYPQIGFWNIYVKFFGDPLTPPRMKPVYRFLNKQNGTNYYTASEATRYRLIHKSSKTWSFKGVAFEVDSSATANAVPLYELYNTHTHKYSYTTSAATRDSLLRHRPKQWTLNGVTCTVAPPSPAATAVYRIQKKSTHGVIFTTSAALKKRLTTGHSPLYKNRSVIFFLEPYVEPAPPAGPTP